MLVASLVEIAPLAPSCTIIAVNNSSDVRPSSSSPTPCVSCGRDLEPVFKSPSPDQEPYVQPSRAITLTSPGSYGSEVFDPVDESFVMLNICDGCLQRALTAHSAVIYRSIPAPSRLVEVPYLPHDTPVL